MNGKVELSEMWGRLMTLLMWPWPLRMFIRWMLIRWSWLGRYSLIGLIFFYEHYHHQNSFWTVAKFPLSQVCQSITHWCWWSSQHRIEFFLPIRFFCLDWYSWLWAVKAAIFFAQKFWSRTEMWGLGALVWIFISPRLSGSTAALHYDASPIEKWEIKELAKMTTSPPIFGRYELFQIKYLDTTFGQFHFLAYIWSGLIIQRRQTFLIALFSWSSSRLAEGCEKSEGTTWTDS